MTETIFGGAKCSQCDQPGRFLCQHCIGVNYCSRSCQRSDWKNHKQHCRRNLSRLSDQIGRSEQIVSLLLHELQQRPSTKVTLALFLPKQYRPPDDGTELEASLLTALKGRIHVLDEGANNPAIRWHHGRSLWDDHFISFVIIDLPQFEFGVIPRERKKMHTYQLLPPPDGFGLEFQMAALLDTWGSSMKRKKETKNETKEETRKNETKAEIKNETKEETKKDETKNETKEETRNETKEETIEPPEELLLRLKTIEEMRKQYPNDMLQLNFFHENEYYSFQFLVK